MSRRSLLLLLAITGIGTGSAQTLSQVESYFDGAGGIDGLNFAWTTAVSPDGKHVYAVSENDTLAGASGNGNDWIAIFERNAATGELMWLNAVAGFRICTSRAGPVDP